MRRFSLALSLRLKFIIVVSLCLVATMTVSIWHLETVQAKAFEQEARQRSEIVANFGEANRQFVSNNLRPSIKKYTKEFILEAMSATYSTRRIFEYFNEALPEYLYRQPTLNPLNPIDQADKFERQIIQRFQSDHTLKEISGYRVSNHRETFYVAKPIQVEASCLKCHLSPKAAPAALVKQYGATQGYGWKVGSIISTLMIDVPTYDLRRNQAALTYTVLATFACLAVILMGLIWIFFDRLVNQRLQGMIQVMGQVSAMPGLTTRLSDRSRDELGFLARTFNRMANSLEVAYADLEQKVTERTATLEQTLEQLKQTQVQVLQAEKMSSLGQLIAGIAHEINNPISFIHGNLPHAQVYAHDLIHLIQLYQQADFQPNTEIKAVIKTEIDRMDWEFIQADFPKILSSMEVGTDRIRQIILSLRNFSRLDEADFKTVDLHQGIDNTLLILGHRFEATADRPTIQILKDYGALPLVECYAGQLNQVFLHLLSNAIDALEEANQDRSFREIEIDPNIISIHTTTEKDSIKIVISDNGIGIPQEIQPRIFDPFFTTKPVGKGTGIGMSISYQIITEKHGGKLECHSISGEGAEFVIQIPISQKQALVC